MTVLIDPPELRRTAAQLVEAGLVYAACGRQLVADLPLAPPLDEARLALELGWCFLRLERLAAELEAEAAAQGVTATIAELADWCILSDSVLEDGLRMGSVVLGDVWNAIDAFGPMLKLSPAWLKIGRAYPEGRIALGLAADTFAYSPLGTHKRVGFVSTDFAAAGLSDITLTVGSVGASAAGGAMVGSIFPVRAPPPASASAW